jgi:hypothetical protein
MRSIRTFIFLAFMLLTCRAVAESVVTKVDSENIDQQDYKFTIVSKKGGKTYFINIRIEPKGKAYWTHFLQTQLTLADGEKQIVSCELARTIRDKAIDVEEFEVSSESLAKATFTFAVMAESNGHPMPAGLFFSFDLKDFADLDKAALIGKWRFAFDNRLPEIREFKPDGTFTRLEEYNASSVHGKASTWKVLHHDLILNLEDGNQEIFSLPIDPKGMEGKSPDGSKLVATKLIPKPDAIKIPYAVPVPGKPGFVFNPYHKHQELVDTRGFPSGTEVKDAQSGKSFLVP